MLFSCEIREIEEEKELFSCERYDLTEHFRISPDDEITNGEKDGMTMNLL